jgi:cytochrome c peroxidase
MPMRNIEKTAPYFHDGSVADLGEAIKIMGKAELMKDLTDQQVAEIETFLNTLTGEIPKEALLTQAQ